MGPPRVPTYYNFAWIPHTFGGLTPPDPPYFAHWIRLIFCRWRCEIFNFCPQNFVTWRLFEPSYFRKGWTRSNQQKAPLQDMPFRMIQSIWAMFPVGCTRAKRKEPFLGRKWGFAPWFRPHCQFSENLQIYRKNTMFVFVLRNTTSNTKIVWLRCL